MTAFNDWNTLSENLAETISRSRLLDLARRGLGISRSLPESAAIDAAIIEALATANNGPPVVADDAALAVRFPAPLNDQLAQVKAAGVLRRYDQAAGKWLGEGLTRAAGPVITANSKGVIGNGVTDDSPFLAAADAAAVASGGRHEIDLAAFNSDGVALTRVYVNSDLTLGAHFRPNSGTARIYVGAGKTLTINGPFDPGAYAVFDPTMPGTVVWGYQRKFELVWSGVVGDGTADDTAALNFWPRMLPDYSRLRSTVRLRCVLTNTWAWDGDHRGIEIVALPSQPDGQGVELLWRGAYGGSMLYFNHADHPFLQGFTFRPGDGAIVGLGGTMTVGSPVLAEPGFQQFTAAMATEHRQAFIFDANHNLVLTTTVLSFQNAGQVTLAANAPSNLTVVRYIIGASSTSGPAAVDIDWDQVGGGATSTQLRVDLCLFNQGMGLRDNVAIRMSKVSINNCEHARISRCAFFGGGTSPQVFDVIENGLSVSTTVGDNLVTIGGGGGLASFNPTPTVYIGQRVQIANGDGVGVPHDDVIISVADSTHFRTRNNFLASVAGERMVMGEGNGTGIYNGFSSNALGHHFSDCLFTALDKGIYSAGGSVNTRRCMFEQCNINRHIEISSVPCTFDTDDSEQAMQDLVLGLKGQSRGIGMVRRVNCRSSALHAKPNSGFVELNHASAAYEDIGTLVPEAVRADVTAFDLSDAFNSVLIKDTLFLIPPTMERAGFNNLGSSCVLTAEGINAITDAPGLSFRKAGGAGQVHSSVVDGIVALPITNIQNLPGSVFPDAKLLNAQASPFSSRMDGGGSRYRFGFRVRHEDGSLGDYNLTPHEWVQLVDGAAVTIDPSKGNYFTLDTTQAALTVNLAAVTNATRGQDIVIRIFKSGGGALTVTWAGSFKVESWTDPGVGKISVIRFTYDHEFNQMVQSGGSMNY